MSLVTGLKKPVIARSLAVVEAVSTKTEEPSRVMSSQHLRLERKPTVRTQKRSLRCLNGACRYQAMGWASSEILVTAFSSHPSTAHDLYSEFERMSML